MTFTTSARGWLDRGRAALGCLIVLAGTSPTALFGQSPPPVPLANPDVAAAPEPFDAVGDTDSLEARVRQLETMLDASLRSRSERESELEARVRQLEAQLVGAGASSTPANPPGVVTQPTPAGRSAGSPPPDAQMPPPPMNVGPMNVKFGPGFQLADEDEEFVLQFHNLTQVDGRFYEQGDMDRAQDTFGIPREWFIFNGRLTKPFEYYVAINQGFDNISLLDAFLNIHYDDRLQLKAGRYKTPFTYEFYALPVQGLITPERSQFFNNYGLNRDVGLMAWGQLFDKRLDYAVGIFNGARNGFLDIDGDSKDVVAYVNFTPFLKSDIEALQHFQFGGSLDAGNQDEPQFPNVLRLNVPTQANAIIGQVFLAYEPDVYESGTRALWSMHAAWYYRQLSLIAEWQSGYENLAFADTRYNRARVPVSSFYVQAGYFLTGEHVTARNVVKPLRPFDVRKGKHGPGAFELATRYNLLDIGDEVFTAGFADPDLWTDRVQTIDLGVNWYLNRYVKIYMGWQRGIYGSPVLFATNPNRFENDTDLWWFRFQVYF